MNSLRDLYQDLILDHGKNPRNFRVIPDATHKIDGHNPLCGDKLSLAVKISRNGIIEDLAFQGNGCAISIASASIMTETIKGKTIEEAKTTASAFHNLCSSCGESVTAFDSFDSSTKTRLEALAGVRNYPVRVKCAMLAWRALEAALNNSGEKTVRTE